MLVDWVENMDLDALIAKARARVETVEPVLVPVTVAGVTMGLRFVPVSGQEWRELTLRHAPRPGIALDENLGYDIDAAVAGFPHVALVDGDDVDDMMRVGEDGKPVSRWPAIYAGLSAADMKALAQAFWAAHEFDPVKAVEAVGKASAGSRRKKHS